jgi:hypothetical protein
MYEGLINNKNAEHWTIEEATKLFNEALALSTQDDYDFIGEVAKDMGTYREIFVYLSDKFQDIQPLYKKILSNLEANCFSHTKKGLIKEATGIVNLKSNYKWTDRTQSDLTTNGKDLLPTVKIIFDKKEFPSDERNINP